MAPAKSDLPQDFGHALAEWDRIFARISALLDSYTAQDD